MAARGVGINEIEMALKSWNVNLPTGTINGPKRAFTLQASGQLMSAAVLLREKSKPSDEDIDHAMTGNICRCGTYPRIRRAIHRAAALAQKEG